MSLLTAAMKNPPPSSPPWDQEPLEILRQVKKFLLLQEAMGVEGYHLPPPLPAISAAAGHPPRDGQGRPGKGQAGSLSLADVRRDLEECQRCRLAPSRTAMIFGAGAEEARLLIIGEWPAPEDAPAGEPFSGEAGALLARMLAAIGLKRQEVYTVYLVKCLSPETPGEEEIKACLPILVRQIEALAPEIICTMGSCAAQTLLNTRNSLLQLRGRFHDFHGIPLMPTFSPSFLARNPEMKKAAWHDLQMIERQYHRKKRP